MGLFNKKEDKKEEAQEEQPEVTVDEGAAKPKELDLRIYGTGTTVEEAQASIGSQAEQYRKDLGLELTSEPEYSLSVALFKGEKPGNSSLVSHGPNLEAALKTAENDFGINPDEFNKKVNIIAVYALTPKESEAVAKADPPSAGPTDPAPKTLNDYIL